MSAAVAPYLNFKGNCAEAFNFYKSVFGGEFESFVRFKDMPMGDQPAPPHVADMVMHVSLPMGKGTSLMGSDAPDGFGPPVTMGNNFYVSVHPENEEEARSIFSGLSAGGQVGMPLENAPWGALFGMCIDKFGINWMVNYDTKKQ